MLACAPARASSDRRIGSRSRRHRRTATTVAVRPAGRALHVACIMDGNGRWAERRGLPRTAGHTEGEENLARARAASPSRATSAGSPCSGSRPRTGSVRAPRCATSSASTSKLFGRVAELNDLNVRIQWIGRPFDSPEARTPTLRPAGDPQGDRRHRRQHRDAAHGRLRLRQPRPSWSTPSRRLAPRRARRSRTESIADAPLPARAAAGRRAGAHARRAAGLQLPAVADRRRARSTSPTSRGPTSTPPSSTPRSRSLGRRPSSGLTPGPSALAPSHRRAARPPRTAPGPARDGRARRRRDRRPAPPRRAGRHRNRQDARLPRAGDRVGQARRRRHRHQGAAGPARQQGPAVPRRAPRRRPFDWAVLKGRSNYVCLQRLREMRADATRASSSSRTWPPRTQRRDHPHRRVGGDDATPATRRARLVAVRRGVAGGQRRQRRVPGRRPVPDGRAVLRRAGPPARRGRRRHRRQHAPLRARTSPAAGRSCPSTTSSCSTRPTGSRTS